jgi:hypothetical protein
VPLSDDRGHERVPHAAEAMGLGEQDFAVIFDVLAHLSGVK